MKFNKNFEYALLLCLYLSKAGRAKTETVATNLNLSINFLQQVARKLKIAKVLVSIKGPGGGYELKGNPTVLQVFDAIDTSKSSKLSYKLFKESEDRAYFAFRVATTQQFRQYLDIPVKKVMESLTKSEMRTLDSVSGTTVN